VIDNIPRYGGDSTMDKEDFEGGRTVYWEGIYSLMAIPAVIMALSVLIAPLWALCRCCKCCCCKKTEPKRDVTGIQIYGPVAWVLSCMIAIIVMAAIGYGANVDFSGALLYNQGEGENGNLFDVLETLMIEASSKMNVIRNITLDLRDGTDSSVNDIQEMLNDTSVLSEGTNSLISTLDDISEIWTNYTVTSEWNGTQYDFTCEFCSTFGEEIKDIKEEIEGNVGPVMDDLDVAVSEIMENLVDEKANITQAMDGFIETVTEFRDYVETAEDDVTESRTTVEELNDRRELSYNIIFAIPLVATFYLLFGVVLKKPACFTCAYCYMWFSCTLMWALLVVHLPVAVLLNDSCDFLDVVDNNVTSVINGSTGEVAQACLTGDPLVATLGLSTYLNFTHKITFPSLGNISDNFQFNQLDEFEGDAFSINFTTFYSEGNDALMAINNLTSTSPYASYNLTSLVWSRENIASLDSSWYYPLNVSNVTDETATAKQTLDDLQDLLMAESVSIAAFNMTVYKIRANLSAVDLQAEDLEHCVQDLANNVENASSLLTPIFDAVEDMEAAAECGFIGDGYENTKLVMCNAVLGPLSRIVVAMFVIAILSMVGCVCSIQLVRRVDRWQEQKKQEKDDKLQQSMQPNKPKIILMQQPSGYPQPGYPRL